MLSLSPRFDLYRFNLPDDFMPDEIVEKWTAILNKEPGVFVKPIEYLNESIKGISLPGISDINIQQTQTSSNPITRSNIGMGRINIEPSHNNTYVGSSNPLDKIEQSLTITFRLNQGMYNYYMIYETIFHRICKNKLYEKGDNFYIDLLDETGVVRTRISLYQCHIDGIDGLQLSKDKIERQSDTFDVKFTFNNIDFDILNIENLG